MPVSDVSFRKSSVGGGIASGVSSGSGSGEAKRRASTDRVASTTSSDRGRGPPWSLACRSRSIRYRSVRRSLRSGGERRRFLPRQEGRRAPSHHRWERVSRARPSAAPSPVQRLGGLLLVRDRQGLFRLDDDGLSGLLLLLLG